MRVVFFSLVLLLNPIVGDPLAGATVSPFVRTGEQAGDLHGLTTDCPWSMENAVDLDLGALDVAGVRGRRERKKQSRAIDNVTGTKGEHEADTASGG